MYVDDTVLSYISTSITNYERNINENLVYLNEYIVINTLTLNIQKCAFLRAGTHQFDKVQGYKY